MGFWNWYHEKRIGRLHVEHPEVGIDIVRLDYMARVRGYGGMGIFMPTTDGRDFEYDLALINSVDENIPNRAGRVALAIIDTLFD